MSNDKIQELEEILKSKVTNLISSNTPSEMRSPSGAILLGARIEFGDLVVSVRREHLVDLFRLLKIDSELQFNLLLDITAIDWLDGTPERSAPERFELVYHLLSTTKLHRLRVKAWVPEDAAEVDSAVQIWPAANFLEREVWDMYGVRFRGHPDLRRILMYDEFHGHPLRKDYPVQGKQPRIPLRSPEVENTARLMQRSELVKISGGRQSTSDKGRVGNGQSGSVLDQGEIGSMINNPAGGSR